MSKWTTPDQLRRQVQKLWDQGKLLAQLCGGESLFPLRLRLKKPGSTQLVDSFAEVREWIDQLCRAADSDPKAPAKGAVGGPKERYRIQWREVNHRILGRNRVPEAVWLDCLDQALALIGRRREADLFSQLVGQTKAIHPQLLPWLRLRPLRALELTAQWPRLLAVVSWLQLHPRPEIYLRQLDLPGVDSKFLEAHRGVLGDLLELTLPEEAIDHSAKGVTGFCRRYGFLDKPARLRFRLLDPLPTLPGADTDQDLTLRHDSFARLRLPINQLFITENEINFLAFPHRRASMVIFGAGYGFEHWAQATWLQRCELYYWGDIDTHGFAILDQLRRIFPQTRSLLMDRETLLAHQGQWGREPRQEKRELTRLTPAESRLYNELRHNLLAPALRLEQEKVSYGYLLATLAELKT